MFFVTWDDAFYYTKWLTEQTGHKYRLPSESEWEYAAGAGKNTPFWWGFEEEPNRGHCFGCGTSFDPHKPTKVGSFGANPFGVFDTAGNVAEWVADCWHDTYNGAPTDAGVWEGGDCVYRIAPGRIDNRIDNESATSPVVDSAVREQRACVAISPPFSALAVHVGRTLLGEEREVSTTKRQRIDNCL